MRKKKAREDNSVDMSVREVGENEEEDEDNVKEREGE